MSGDANHDLGCSGYWGGICICGYDFRTGRSDIKPQPTPPEAPKAPQGPL